MLTLQQWRCGEIVLADPAAPRCVDTGIQMICQAPSGREIIREAFWDGDDTFRIRFAPTELGEWKYTITGLADGSREGHLTCIPYDGQLPLYQHGFLKVGPKGRYLCHADNTPFFWLGDTHWHFAIAERWDESNDPRFDSQFRAIVDRRVQQKFNVYQCNFHCEATEPDKYFLRTEQGLIPNLDFLQQDLDKKISYLADQGFCIAAGFSWAFSAFAPDAMKYYKTAVRYLIARYGAYPMIWTLAGETGGYSASGRKGLLDFWREIAKEVERLDTYHHLQTAHYTNERPFADYYQDEDWFDFTLNQAGHGDYPIDARHYQAHRKTHSGKPFIESESLYEQVLTLEPNGRRRATPAMLRRVAYLSIQSGGCGYTYGAQGMWHIQWDESDGRSPLGFGSYPPWYKGIDFPGASQMTIMRDFYESVGWYHLTPLPRQCFDLSANGAVVVTFSDEDLVALFVPAITADEEMRTVVAYFSETCRYETIFRTLIQPCYKASWLDPATGSYTLLNNAIVPQDGCWTSPVKPSDGDAILLLQALE